MDIPKILCLLCVRVFFFFLIAGVAKVNSPGRLFGRQGREERGREPELVQMCPDNCFISIDLC